MEYGIWNMEQRDEERERGGDLYIQVPPTGALGYKILFQRIYGCDNPGTLSDSPVSR